MTPANGGPGSREPNALSTSAGGAALAGLASLAWPGLWMGTVALAVLTGVIVWVRALRALRRTSPPELRPRRWLPLLALGGSGWAAEILLEPLLPWARAPLLGAVSVGLWVLAGPAGVRG